MNGILKRLYLAMLRGREQTLHNRIASGYARGQHLADMRREQNEVRRLIRLLTGEERR